MKDAFAALKNSQNIFASVTAPEDNKEYYLIHVKQGFTTNMTLVHCNCQMDLKTNILSLKK